MAGQAGSSGSPQFQSSNSPPGGSSRIDGVTLDIRDSLERKLSSKLDELTQTQKRLLVVLSKGNKDLISQIQNTDKNVSSTIKQTSNDTVREIKNQKSREAEVNRTLDLINKEIKNAEELRNRQKQIAETLLKRDEVQSKINSQSIYMTGLLAGDVKSVTKSLLVGIQLNVEAQKEYRLQLEKNRQILRKLDEEFGYEEANANFFDAVGSFLPSFSNFFSRQADKYRVKSEVMKGEKSQISSLMKLQEERARATGEDTKMAYDDLFKIIAKNNLIISSGSTSLFKEDAVKGPSEKEDTLKDFATETLSKVIPSNFVSVEVSYPVKEPVSGGGSKNLKEQMGEVKLSDVFVGEKKTPETPKVSDLTKLSPEFGLGPLFLGLKIDELIKLQREATRKLSGKIDDLIDLGDSSEGGIFGMIGSGLGGVVNQVVGQTQKVGGGNKIEEILKGVGRGLKSFLKDLGAGLKELGKELSEKLKGVLVLVALGGVLAGTLWVLSMIGKIELTVLLGVFVFSKALEGLADTLKKLSKIKQNELIMGGLAMAAISGILVLGSFGLSLLKGIDTSILLGVIVFSGSVFILSKVLAELSKLSIKELLIGGLAMTVISGIIVLGAFGLSLLKGIDPGVSLLVLVFTGAVIALGFSAVLIGSFAMTPVFWMGLLAIGAVVAVLAIGLKVLGEVGRSIDPKAAVNLKIMAESLLAFANPVLAFLLVTSFAIGSLGGALTAFSIGYSFASLVVKIFGMDLLSNLIEFGKIDASNLMGVAAGITALSGALAAFGGGSFLGGIGSFFGNLLGGDQLKKFKEFSELSDPLSKTADAMDRLVSALAKMEEIDLRRLGDSIRELGRAFEVSMIPSLIGAMTGTTPVNDFASKAPVQTVEDLYISEDGTMIEKSPKDKLLFIQDLNTVQVIPSSETKMEEDNEDRSISNDRVISLLAQILEVLNKLVPGSFPEESGRVQFLSSQNPLRFGV